MSGKALSLLWMIGLLLPGCTSSQSDSFSRAPTSGSKTVTKSQSGVPGTLLAGCRRVVFLGDSITYSGQFVDDLEMALRRSAPTSQFEFLDLGLPSETISGLSEPGHAGGSFPRPTLHERLERLLELARPDLVVACYGMNDGIYHPFSESRFDAFQQGILLLRERVLSSGAKIIHVTPPVFDSTPIRQHTLPAGRNEYRQPFEGYDTVLERYSEWLVGQRKKGWTVIDVHSPMKTFIQHQRLKNPGFVLAPDGVHLNESGHWLLAQILLTNMKAAVSNERIVIDFASGKVKGDGIISSQKLNGGATFSWRTLPPVPLPPGNPDVILPLQEHCLVGLNAKAVSYELLESDKPLATASREELSAGIDTRRFPELSTTAHGKEILNLIHTRNRMLSDSWLTKIGHKRPGMSKGLPLEEAVTKAEELNQKIKNLNQPAELRFTLLPTRN
jgi:lysophospholipase L1-like esterase